MASALMGFLNLVLLGGTAAVSIPLVIHLLNRSRFQRVDWGAIHLLEAAITTQNRRIQWQSNLLLLVRCVIPILLAVALARPVLNPPESRSATKVPAQESSEQESSAKQSSGQGTWGGLNAFSTANSAADQSLALVIDDSFSLQAAEDQSTPYFDRLRDELLSLVDDTSQAEFSVVLAGSSPFDPLNGATVDRSLLRRILGDIRPEAGTAELLPAIQNALRSLSQSTRSDKQLIIASDLRGADWNQLDNQALASVADQCANQEINLWILSPAHDAGRFSNLGISTVDMPREQYHASELVRVEFLLHNFSDQNVDSAEVVISVDDSELTTRRVQIGSGAVERIPFECRIPENGLHTISAIIRREDTLALDNVAHLVIEITDAPKVLIVHPPEETIPYIGLALSPFASSEDNTFAIRQLTPGQLGAAKLNTEVVILDGVQRLSSEQSLALADHVRTGGGLIIFPDSNIDTQWYRDQTIGDQGWLPLAYGDMVSSEPVTQVRSYRAESATIPLDLPVSPTLFGRLEVSKWFRVERDSALQDGPQMSTTEHSVAIRLANGNPLLIHRTLGRGHVYQWTIAAQQEWSNLPLDPAFVPLMQSVVRSAIPITNPIQIKAGARKDFLANISVDADQIVVSRQALQAGGPPLSVALTDSTASGNDSDQSNSLSAVLRYPGRYQVVRASEGEAVASGISPDTFVVLRDSRESNLGLLTPSERRRVTSALGATTVETAKQLQQEIERQSTGRELWRWCLAIVLFLIFLELLLMRQNVSG